VRDLISVANPDGIHWVLVLVEIEEHASGRYSILDSHYQRIVYPSFKEKLPRIHELAQLANNLPTTTTGYTAFMECDLDAMQRKSSDCAVLQQWVRKTSK
jgi:hypothetical protein